jgi:uncharacterized protein YjiS (DUF1127 family)
MAYQNSLTTAGLGGAPSQGTTWSLSGSMKRSARSMATSAWAILCEWRRRSYSRAELRSLSRREIADVCPGFTEVEQEARKRFWRP